MKKISYFKDEKLSSQGRRNYSKDAQKDNSDQSLSKRSFYSPLATLRHSGEHFRKVEDDRGDDGDLDKENSTISSYFNVIKKSSQTPTSSFHRSSYIPEYDPLSYDLGIVRVFQESWKRDWVPLLFLLLSVYLLLLVVRIMSDNLERIQRYVFEKAIDSMSQAYDIEVRRRRGLFNLNYVGVMVRNRVLRFHFLQKILLPLPSYDTAAKLGIDILVGMECGLLCLHIFKKMIFLVCAFLHSRIRAAIQKAPRFIELHPYTFRGWVVLLITSLFVSILALIPFLDCLILNVGLSCYSSYLRISLLVEELPPSSLFTNYIKRFHLRMVALIIGPAIVYQLLKLWIWLSNSKYPQLMLGKSATWALLWVYWIWRFLH